MKVFAKYLILLFLTISLFTDSYHSQATFHYVGTENLQNTNSSFPSIYGNFFRGVKHQILVKATELQTAGISAGNITGLAFDIVSNSGNVLTGFEIEIKSTTQQSLSTWSNNNLATYFCPSSFTDQIGWNQHDFSSPFYWDGSSNIIIQTCFYNNSWSQNAVMNMSNYGYNSLVYRRRDNSSPCNSNWINGVETQKPNIRFSWVDPSSPPISNFSTSGTSTCSGLVNFYDQTSNSPNNWFWNFGDGNTSTQQNPIHSYNSSGNFTVELITSNSFGNDTITYSNLIQVNLTNTPPIAPSCTPTTGIAGSTTIGSRCMIGGQVGFAGHLKIADGVKIAAQSGVTTSIKEPDSVWQGTPATPIKDYQKRQIALRNLSRHRLMDRLEELEKIQQNTRTSS